MKGGGAQLIITKNKGHFDHMARKSMVVGRCDFRRENVGEVIVTFCIYYRNIANEDRKHCINECLLVGGRTIQCGVVREP